MNNTDRHIFQRLIDREQNGLKRHLNSHVDKVDFSSNDYLGLASNQELFQAINREIENHVVGPLNGSRGSRLLAGHYEYYDVVENELAHFFEAEAALIFNSGYTANLSILSSLPLKGDTIIVDEFIHASLIDGARLSFANKFSFQHNDVEDLEKKLKNAKGQIFVAIESLYSMDGDFGKLKEIILKAKAYNAFIIVDEAHTTAVYGKGKGYVYEQGLSGLVDAVVYTFGKGVGLHGACIVGSEMLKAHLINFARPFIYSTAMSPHSYAAIRVVFQTMNQYEANRISLFKNIDCWNNEVGVTSAFSKNKSAIQTVICKGNEQVKKLAIELQELGYDVRPIMSPTVPEGFERLRVCLHATNTHQQIVSFINFVKDKLYA
jgi:8-amino-7-oxononanoate synthase